MNYTAINGIIALALAAGCDKTDSPPVEVTPPAAAATWGGCAEVKAQLTDANRVFVPPDYTGEIETWQASFFGSHFHIPRGNWDPLPALNDDGSWTLVMLERDTGDVVVWNYGTQPDTEEDQARRRKSGGPATTHELMLMGYRHTAADITCAKEAEERETMIANALFIKGVAAPGETLAVHHDVHGLDDFARFAKLTDNDGKSVWQWEVWYPLDDKYVQATYRLGDETRARALAAKLVAGRGIMKDTAETLGGPRWLGLLESALNGEDDAWAELAADLEKSNAGGKAIGAVRRLAPAPADPK